MTEDSPERQIRAIVDAFQNALRASIQTLVQTDAESISDFSPEKFVSDYCANPLGYLGVTILDAELRKEVELHFYSLDERRHEFIPVDSMRNLKDAKRFEVTVSAETDTLKFIVFFVYSVQSNNNAVLDDIKIDEITLKEGDSRGFIEYIKGSEPFYKNIFGTVIGTLVAEGIKKMLGG